MSSSGKMESSSRSSSASSKFQRSKSKSPSSAASRSGSPYKPQPKRSKSSSKGSRARLGSRERTPSSTKPEAKTLEKKKISNVLHEELLRLRRLACIEGDENNNYLEDIDNYQTQTIRLEVCPEYRVFQMNGRPDNSNAPAKNTSIPDHNDALIVSTKIPSRVFLRNLDEKLKPKLTASFYRCAVSNDDEADKPRLTFQTRPKPAELAIARQEPLPQMEASNRSTGTTMSLLDVASDEGEGGRIGIEYFTDIMRHMVPGDLESHFVTGAFELGSHVLNAGWKVATSLMPDESDMEPQSDLIKVNGYEIKSVGRGILVQAIYINSDRHNALPPGLERISLDPSARLRIWVQLRRDPRPYKGLHGYHDIEPQVSVTDTQWILKCGDASMLTISVPNGVCTAHISRVAYPDGSLIVQAP